MILHFWGNVRELERIFKGCICDVYCGQRSSELNIQLINLLGTSKYIQTTGKTYNAPQITLTQKAHYQHIPQFPIR